MVGGGSFECEEVGVGYNSEDEYEVVVVCIEVMDFVIVE